MGQAPNPIQRFAARHAFFGAVLTATLVTGPLIPAAMALNGGFSLRSWQTVVLATCWSALLLALLANSFTRLSQAEREATVVPYAPWFRRHGPDEERESDDS